MPAEKKSPKLVRRKKDTEEESTPKSPRGTRKTTKSPAATKTPKSPRRKKSDVDAENIIAQEFEKEEFHEEKHSHAPRQSSNRSVDGATNSSEDEEVVEFGGWLGSIAIVIFSHFLLYYVSFCLFGETRGELSYPTSTAGISPFFKNLYDYAVTRSAPTREAAIIYYSFVGIQFLLAAILPGINVRGLPQKDTREELEYRCNGLFSWYISLALFFLLHHFRLYDFAAVVDQIPNMMAVAIISSNILSVLSYIFAHLLGQVTRPTNNIIYDWFIGLWLNPRIAFIPGFDLKFWGETRISWLLLFFFTLCCSVRQYEEVGYVSSSMILMLLAHFLYANACMKGEECIVTTWDVFHEKWGWMLIFWNFAGVPFLYATSSLFIAFRNPQVSPYIMLPLFILLIAAYYVWDTSQSQRNRYRMMQRNVFVERMSFPQLPWGTIYNPLVLETKNGSTLLIDGWWRYARKIHYTMDILMAFCWGGSTGFTHLLPFLYFFFFTGMIIHRYQRDMERCSRKYKSDWVTYCNTVKYAFIPGVF